MAAPALSSPFSTASADELTLRDVESLAAFLYARLEELKTAHDDEVRRLASGFRFLLSPQLQDTRAAFGYGGPPAPLAARRRQWNNLVRFGSGWKGCDGYDSQLWKHVRHDDADKAARAAAERLERL
ncbi:hypothetical protein OG711_38935 (plasmid) [Streptomyces uncialis]|uniref:hypothetical protein n=1 Tax=Streptomyces uncialis TaxID=1048205 RepID=UPI002E33AB63|nr:hypothetical protein [Streptomyces uncialis]WTE16071.1 hypothetical protein OG924_37420 [Streptomyces uncialis]